MVSPLEAVPGMKVIRQENWFPIFAAGAILMSIHGAPRNPPEAAIALARWYFAELLKLLEREIPDKEVLLNLPESEMTAIAETVMARRAVGRLLAILTPDERTMLGIMKG